MLDSRGLDRIAEFVSTVSRSGAPTAYHAESGIWLHSRVDPVREAQIIAHSFNIHQCSEVVLIGGGLGYLPEAMLSCDLRLGDLTVIEPHSALIRLAHNARPDSRYHTSPRIRVITTPTPATLSSKVSGIEASATVLWSPYLASLSRASRDPLLRIIHLLQSERVANTEYSALLRSHANSNAEFLRRLPVAHCESGDTMVVTGAGPSLDPAADSLRQQRNHYLLVSVSGAVPALIAHGIVPDWVIALEARDAVVRDLASLPTGSRVIVFPSTHPALFQREDLRFFKTWNNEAALLTRGGTSVVPALDLALCSEARRVLLIGVDLGLQSGRYASHTLREAAPPSSIPLPKFEAMRTGLERAIEIRRGKNQQIYHVLNHGRILAGTIRLKTSDLNNVLRSRYEGAGIQHAICY